MAKTNLARMETAIVTGAASGIGREICRRLVARGVRCVMVDIDQPRLSELAAELGALGVPELVDITDHDAIVRLIAGLPERFGGLDILINNAAMLGLGHFEQRPVDSIVRELHVNLISPVVLSRLAIPLLQKARDGRIINIVSLGGIFPLPETTVYSASKFGLRGAMLCLGLDSKRLGIRVGNVLPSATETPALMREAVEGGNNLQFMDPPQQPADVVRRVMALLDRPMLEVYPRWTESLMVRVIMLAPNLLPRLIPLFRKRGDRGHLRYLKSLQDRGLAYKLNGAWHLSPTAGGR